ncbi:MAG TPA: carboxypeptidase-like regulatory domain-containing protein, partial [Kofleriaceae bacterium]|nr:carboxypeptidase-like regulatory domain-containing protein [Kofleriaceae bacterium]
VAGLAPNRAKGWSPGQFVRVDAGQAVTGTVRDPKNALLEGATVQLTLDGVPSTVATTAADGSFALRAATPPSAAPVTVDVVPPAASGLPRLTATSQSFNLGMPLQIRYTSAPAPVDLAGTAVQRPDQSRIAGARVTVVGSIAAAGTITAGMAVTATGQVRITTAADAGGTLPTRLVPVAPLSSVIEDGTGVLAVVALDTTSGVPARLTAPPLVAAPIMVSGADAAPAPGATLDLVPTGTLGMASTVTLHFVADATGALQPPPRLPPGGHYELRLADPLARFAPLFIADRAVEAIAPSFQLSTGVRLGGVVQRANAPLGGASVQILCNDCTGIAHDKPLVEVVTNAVGQFTLVMPDPGTR